MARYVVGVDEAGRGPLAGPVAVGFVLAPKGFALRRALPGVADSKTLSEKKREEIFSLLGLYTKEIRYCVVYVSPKRIDKEGIAVVIRKAVAQGLQHIAPDPACVAVLLDGSLKAPPEYTQKTIIRGDASEPAISLASIVAKVSRDRLMRRLDKRHPQYGFAVHKGYGTRAHYAAIAAHDLSTQHRKTFCRKVLRSNVK